MQAAGPDSIDQCAGEGDSGGDGEAAESMRAVDQDEREAGHGGERRERIERDAEGTVQLGPLDAQEDDAHVLQEELEKDARDDQHSDDLVEGKETEARGNQPEGNKRAVGNVVARMHGGEKRK